MTNNKTKVLLIVDRDGTIIKEKGYLGSSIFWPFQIKYKKEILSIIKRIQKNKTKK